MSSEYSILEEEGSRHMAESKAGEATSGERSNPMEKMRVRLAAEGYSSMSGPQDSDNNNQGNKGSKGSCTSSEKQLTAFILICLVIIGLMSAFLVLERLQIRELHQVCVSPDCVELSGNMLSQMDLTIDPCDDFYEYACARGLRDPESAPPDRSKWSSFSKVSQRNMAVLNRLLAEGTGTYKKVKSSAMMKTKFIYDSCLNTTQKEGIGKTPLLEAIKYAGSWAVMDDPVAGTWNADSWLIERSVAMVQLLSGSPLFSFGVGTDDRNSNNHIIAFDQGGTMFSDYHAYSGNDTEKYHLAFVRLFTQVVVLLGGEETKASLAAEDVWRLECNISAIKDKPENRTDPVERYHKMPISKLQSMLRDSFDLSEFLKLVFGLNIAMDTEVLVYSPAFFSKLAAVISSTDQATLANYVTWHHASSLLSLMPTPYRLALMEMRRVLTGVQAQEPLWEQCVSTASDATGFAVGALFIEKTFSRNDKIKVEQLLAAIRAAFKENLPSLEWMDTVTKKKALEKVEALVQKIGYPDFIEDPMELDKYYEKLLVTENDDFGNALASRKFYVEKNLKLLNTSTDRSIWDMFPQTVNAYYSPVFNEMVFPAGILQQPFYDSIFPASLMYGAIGMVIGHELTHGFDNQGRQYDKLGNLNNWWLDSSTKAFQERSQCLVDQYSNYSVYSKKLNGLTTLGENIADNGGLKLSLQAYHDLREAETVDHDELLPGLNMTHNQLFFLSFAQMWCSYYTPQYAELSTQTDAHSYAKYRVIGVLQNTVEFSEAFSCGVDSAMNPQKKCQLW